MQDNVKRLDDRTSLLYTLNQKNLTLLSDLKSYKKKISTLTRDILRLQDKRLEANHDDHYFATYFARMFRTVEEWVYVTYIDANVEGLQQLEEDSEAVNIFRERAGEEWKRWVKEEHILLLTGAMTEVLVSKMLELPLLGMKDSCVALVIPAIEKSLADSKSESEPTLYCG